MNWASLSGGEVVLFVNYWGVKLFFYFPIVLFPLCWPAWGQARVPRLSCDQYLGHFQNLQKNISAIPSDVSSDGGILTLKNLQEKFDQHSAKLSLYEGLQTINGAVTDSLGPSQDSLQEAALKFSMADSFLDMVEDFRHSVGPSAKTFTQQVRQHLLTKCQTAAGPDKPLFCSLSRRDNPSITKMRNQLISAYAGSGASQDADLHNEFRAILRHLKDSQLKGKIGQLYQRGVQNGDDDSEAAQIMQHLDVLGSGAVPNGEDLEKTRSGIDESHRAIERVKQKDQYKEMEWFRDYAALKLQQDCDPKEGGADAGGAGCPANFNSLESEWPIQFAEELDRVVADLRREQSFEAMERERRSRCDKAHERANTRGAGVSDKQAEDRFEAYLVNYAELCRTRAISRSPPGLPVAANPDPPPPPANSGQVFLPWREISPANFWNRSVTFERDWKANCQFRPTLANAFRPQSCYQRAAYENVPRTHRFGGQ